MMAQHLTNIGSVHHVDLIQTAGTQQTRGIEPMLFRRLNRWNNIKTRLPRCQYFVLAGYMTLLHTAKTKYLLILQMTRYCLLRELLQTRMRQ